AIQPTWGGSGDAFLAKLNPAGSALVYSTYLGGGNIDSGSAVAIDPAGNAYIVGTTFSTNFPTKNPFQAAKGSQQDAFVAKINPGGTAWVYSTYLGGNNVDEGYGIAVDATGNAYVTGYTASTNFPLQSPFQSSNNASVDAFVTKLNPAGSALVYSTYLGGTGTDYGTAIAVDLSGSAYVTGLVASEDFPVVNPIDGTLGSHAVDDAFVAKFTPSGSALIYSTYIGGGSEDDAYALAIDEAGNAYITGRTNSSDFPLANPIQTTRFAFDMFVTEINASGSALVFSTFIGGSGSESGRGIAVDQVGNIHIAGETTSTDFPILKAMQTANGGGAVSQDACVLLLGNTPPSSGSGSLSAVSPTSLHFGATPGGATLTGAQTVVVQASAGLVWTASPNQSFISVSPGSGTGAGSFTIGIVPGALPASGSVTGTVTISASGVASKTVTVTATVVSTTIITGSFDTPAN
ncbi:MAG: SBBP repeat-containing protein, partial [Bryobacteraceae bacterium]